MRCRDQDADAPEQAEMGVVAQAATVSCLVSSYSHQPFPDAVGNANSLSVIFPRLIFAWLSARVSVVWSEQTMEHP
jgi:hypothetical protein